MDLLPDVVSQEEFFFKILTIYNSTKVLSSVVVLDVRSPSF